MKKYRPLLRLLAPLLLTVVPSALSAQETSIQIPAGTPLPVQLAKHVPMKKGESLDCRLLYPVYEQNQMVIPAGSIVSGSIIALKPDRSRRIHAWLWGDFTPFNIPVVHFDQLALPDGTIKQIASNNATDGAPVLHLSPPGPKKPHSFIYRQIIGIKEQAKHTVSLVTAPGRKDRLVQFLYRQLPYHPQRIEAATMWTVTLRRPLTLKPYKISTDAKSDPSVSSPVQHKQRLQSPSQASTTSSDTSAWHLRAYLEQTVSSATEKRGNTFQAIVAEPVFNSDHTLAVPEGSVLVGTITQVRPARSFGRAGKLRFDFRELKLPGGTSQQVEGSLVEADTAKSQQLQIDSEGGVQSEAQNRVIVPLVLTFLAGRALDDDGNMAGNTAVASNGFGIIGRVIGIASGSRDVAAGIGFYAAAVSFSERWLVRGQNVVFRKNTRIEVTTVPSPAPLPVPLPQRNPSKRH
jgi:hypothetical protein